jgi:hypothetical protein
VFAHCCESPRNARNASKLVLMTDGYTGAFSVDSYRKALRKWRGNNKGGVFTTACMGIGAIKDQKGPRKDRGSPRIPQRLALQALRRNLLIVKRKWTTEIFTPNALRGLLRGDVPGNKSPEERT